MEKLWPTGSPFPVPDVPTGCLAGQFCKVLSWNRDFSITEPVDDIRLAVSKQRAKLMAQYDMEVLRLTFDSVSTLEALQLDVFATTQEGVSGEELTTAIAGLAVQHDFSSDAQDALSRAQSAQKTRVLSKQFLSVVLQQSGKLKVQTAKFMVRRGGSFFYPEYSYIFTKGTAEMLLPMTRGWFSSSKPQALTAQQSENLEALFEIKLLGHTESELGI